MPLEVNNVVKRSTWRSLRCRWSIKKETTANQFSLFFVNGVIPDDDDDPKQSIWTKPALNYEVRVSQKCCIRSLFISQKAFRALKRVHTDFLHCNPSCSVCTVLLRQMACFCAGLSAASSSPWITHEAVHELAAIASTWWSVFSFLHRKNRGNQLVSVPNWWPKTVACMFQLHMCCSAADGLQAAPLCTWYLEKYRFLPLWMHSVPDFNDIHQ